MKTSRLFASLLFTCALGATFVSAAQSALIAIGGKKGYDAYKESATEVVSWSWGATNSGAGSTKREAAPKTDRKSGSVIFMADGEARFWATAASDKTVFEQITITEGSSATKLTNVTCTTVEKKGNKARVALAFQDAVPVSVAKPSPTPAEKTH